jgi:aspartate/methionine/tyrosine aminotransferase
VDALALCVREMRDDHTPMKLPPFLLDQWLAAHEFADPPIRYNLASSTGPQWTLGDLLALADAAGHDARRQIEELKLSYAPPQGGARLRQRIASLQGVDPDQVLVMTGASEALLTLICHFAEPGKNLVLPRPCYPAVPVMARAWGMEVRTYRLDAERAFVQSADDVLAAVNADTRAVFVNSPHNPTGSVMPVTEQRELADALAARGIPLIMDEVYHPLYFGGDLPTAASLPNTIVVGDFAKALSLPGLRIGWLVDRDAQRREALLDARSYFTISGSPLSEALGALALEHASTIFSTLRETAATNLAMLTRFMDAHREQLAFAPPAGGTTCFPRLRSGENARPLSMALARAGVLVAPGDCFDAPAHLRIGFGAMRDGYAEALQLFGQVLAAIRT